MLGKITIKITGLLAKIGLGYNTQKLHQLHMKKNRNLANTVAEFHTC